MPKFHTKRCEILAWRGLRDDFRTMDWQEILNDWGADAKQLDYFLAKSIGLSNRCSNLQNY